MSNMDVLVAILIAFVGVTGKVMPKTGNCRTLIVSPTVIPSQYKKPVEVTVTNASDQPFVISRGIKVAQLQLSRIKRNQGEEFLI